MIPLAIGLASTTAEAGLIVNGTRALTMRTVAQTMEDAMDAALEAGMPVASTAIRMIQYDDGTSTLTVTFTDGSTGTYTTSKQTAMELAGAASPGRYFNLNIR